MCSSVSRLNCCLYVGSSNTETPTVVIFQLSLIASIGCSVWPCFGNCFEVQALRKEILITKVTAEKIKYQHISTFMLNCKIDRTVHFFLLKKSDLAQPNITMMEMVLN